LQIGTHSPAIGTENNLAVLGNDQRGAPYMRVSGIATDISAYKEQQADIIFNSSFEISGITSTTVLPVDLRQGRVHLQIPILS
jgi:hypothetical protein